MRTRCTNPKADNYKHYGGAGITVCTRWLMSFSNFYNDMGPRPDGYTLGRKNNSLGYIKSNCAWVGRIEQMRNRSITHLITAFGKTKCLSAWSNTYGVPAQTILDRLGLGYTPEDSVSKYRIMS